jgi:hypothetical protein
MPFVGGLLADQFGLVVPVILAALAVLLIAPVSLGLPETAPRVLARRSLSLSPSSEALA